MDCEKEQLFQDFAIYFNISVADNCNALIQYSFWFLFYQRERHV